MAKKQSENNILLPEFIVTPRGNYMSFTGKEAYKPTLKEYLESKAQESRINAVNHIVHQSYPNVPRLPSDDWASQIAGWFGKTAEERIQEYGTDPDPFTCIYTVTSQYGDEDSKVAGNKTFKRNPQKYGFVPVSMGKTQEGDLIQFWDYTLKGGLQPHHSTMQTGTSDDNQPLLTYSNGFVHPYEISPDGEIEYTMKKDRRLNEVKAEVGLPTAYRYVGSDSKKQEWAREYRSKYNPPFRANGGFLSSNSAWDKLSIAEKAKMMEVAINNGIYNLNDIRQKYNEFAEGGGISDEEYYSTMEKVAEDNYQKWGLSSPDKALVHALNDNTYNYRGYYDKYPQSEANADTHWTDEFKTAYHPTFSVESSYSGQESQYNPQGLYGGHWVGDKFIPAPWQRGPLVEAAMNEYANGGGIHIKPSHRGRLTELKKRTGKTEAELYNDGNPAHKKMVVFARSARKWKHGLGGNLFDGRGTITYEQPFYSYDDARIFKTVL